MNYLDLVRLALPEIIVVGTALGVLTLGLLPRRLPGICAVVSAAGLLFAAAAVLQLPAHATLFHGMLVISPLNSL
ncbi:MAG: NADH-quinone oxidoreductase subunit N, partial [Chthoniobacterales bacterium]